MRHLPREGSARAVRLHSQHQLRGCFLAIGAGLRSKTREVCSQLLTMNMRSARWTTMGNVTSPLSQPVSAPTLIFDPPKGAFISSEMQIRERVHDPRVNFGPCRPGAPRFVTKLRISFSEALVLREFLADRGRAARRPCGETVIWAASRADALGGGLMRLEDLVLLASY